LRGLTEPEQEAVRDIWGIMLNLGMLVIWGFRALQVCMHRSLILSALFILVAGGSYLLVEQVSRVVMAAMIANRIAVVDVMTMAIENMMSDPIATQSRNEILHKDD
jgi:hypothetical protein